MHKIIIDGFNFLFFNSKFKSMIDEGRTLLEVIIKMFDEFKKLPYKLQQRLVFVFDGDEAIYNTPKERMIQGFKVIFAVPGSADKKIIEMVKRSQNPKSLTVVTNDNEILNTVRSYKVKTEKIASFKSWLESSSIKEENDDEDFGSKIEPRLSEQDLDYWQNLFDKKDQKNKDLPTKHIDKKKRNVSIIILNYNGEAFLKDCLDSIRNQTYQKELTEVIIVDNNSKDNSVALIEKEYPDVKILKNKKNTGFGKGINIGVENSESAYVAFLNNDMRVDRNWLSKMVDCIDEKKGVICVGSKILNWDGSLIDFGGSNINFMGVGTQKGYKQPNNELKLSREFIPFACGGSMLISRKVFIEIGGFDEDFVFYNEDTDLGWRLWIYGYKIIFEPEAITYHHHHGTGDKLMTSAVKQAFCDRNALYTMLKNLGDDSLSKFLPLALISGMLRIPATCGIDTKRYFFEPSNESFEPPQESFTIESKNLSIIAAIEDISRDFPKIIDKRKKIQAKRVISDSELLSLFKGFLNTGYFSYNYWEEFDKVIHSFPMDELISDSSLKLQLYDASENEQIELQKEHIKHLEGIIFDKKNELESCSGELNTLKNEYDVLMLKFKELEDFALKVHQNPLFKLYTKIKKNPQ
jgi:GT2 family glycosyltransferase